MSRFSRSWPDALAALPAAAGIMHAVLSLGLIGENEILWLAGLSPLACFGLGWKRALALAGILVAATLALGGLISISGLDRKLFYSPATELADFDLATGQYCFRPDTDLDMVLPYGDLNARLADKMPSTPRTLRYRTDSLGFRNNKDFHGQGWVLVGDSFVAGLSNTQTEVVSEILGLDMKQTPYNLGYPGDVADYAARVRLFRERFGPEARLAVFFYEGNDFGDVKDKLAGKSLPRVWAWRLKTWYRYTSLGRTMHYLAVSLREKPDPGAVAVASLDGKPLGFLKDYVDVTRRESFTPNQCFREKFAELAKEKPLVFFIPTKYRVYHRLLAPDEPALPHANYEALQALCREHGLECADLTPALLREAARLAPGGGLVWWPDDTHWNPAGTRAAAGAVRLGVR